MRERYGAALALALVLAVSGAWGAAVKKAKPARPVQHTTYGKITITSEEFEGSMMMKSPFVYSKNVVVTSQDFKMTCDRLKVWPAKNGNSFDRLEATGQVHITGHYVDTEASNWSVDGRSEQATYDTRTGRGRSQGVWNSTR